MIAARSRSAAAWSPGARRSRPSSAAPSTGGAWRTVTSAAGAISRTSVVDARHEQVRGAAGQAAGERDRHRLALQAEPPDRGRRERRELVGDVVDQLRRDRVAVAGRLRDDRRQLADPVLVDPLEVHRLGHGGRLVEPEVRRHQRGQATSPARARRPPGRPPRAPTCPGRTRRRGRRRSRPGRRTARRRPSGARPTALIPDPQITATPQPSGVPARSAAIVSLNRSVSRANARAA